MAKDGLTNSTAAGGNGSRSWFAGGRHTQSNTYIFFLILMSKYCYNILSGTGDEEMELDCVDVSFIHPVFCLTTGPKPPPKRFLHIVRSRASSFK